MDKPLISVEEGELIRYVHYKSSDEPPQPLLFWKTSKAISQTVFVGTAAFRNITIKCSLSEYVFFLRTDLQQSEVLFCTTQGELLIFNTR